MGVDLCRQIAAQTNTMMLAGYETTANTLAFSVYLLGKHPQAQQCLLQEIDQFQGRPGYDSLASFPYAAAVINEALRLYPPATFLTRVTNEDVQVCSTILQSVWFSTHNQGYLGLPQAIQLTKQCGHVPLLASVLQHSTHCMQAYLQPRFLS